MNNLLQSCFLTGLKVLGTVTSGIGSDRKLQVMVYHRVLDDVDIMRPSEVSKVHFAWQMDMVSKYFNVLPLSEGIKRLKSGSLPPRAVAITFDDGYKDNYKNALPILKHHSLPATLFVAVGYLNGGRMWNDSIIEAIRGVDGCSIDLTSIGLENYSVNTMNDRFRAAQNIIGKLKYSPQSERSEKAEYIASMSSGLPTDLMLTSEELKDMVSNGIDVGGHTISHPILSELDSKVALREIEEGKHVLEAITGKDVSTFAYPNGKPGKDYSLEHANMVENCGYVAALSTEWGVGTSQSDVFQLPRFTPWDASKEKFMARMIYMYSRGI